MSVRNRRGHYTAEMVKRGFRDQYAVHRSYGAVTIEIYHDGTNAYAWHVALIITNTDRSESTDRSFATLNEARHEYRRLVRNHP